MNQSLGQVTIVVRDYDEPLSFYVGILGFRLIEDTPVPAQRKRWVVVAPVGSTSHLLLAHAVGDEQSSRIGNQTGGRVFLFLYTDDFWRDFRSIPGIDLHEACHLRFCLVLAGFVTASWHQRPVDAVPQLLPLRRAAA
jgi:catechol 2,3-dioxygenase-like lactoylglutathione lyase family enzyme